MEHGKLKDRIYKELNTFYSCGMSLEVAVQKVKSRNSHRAEPLIEDLADQLREEYNENSFL